MRLCPTVEGSATPLITHRIGADVCLARQATNFHKCHRCIYRGKQADWVSDRPEHELAEVHAAEEINPVDVKRVEIPRRQPTAASARSASAAE